MRKQGIIVSSTRVNGGTEYLIFDGEKYHRRTTRKRLRGGVEFDEKGVYPSDSAWKAVHDRFVAGLKPKLELPDEIAFIRGQMEVLWKELAFLKVAGVKPMVFFDGDADGLISTMLISEAIGPLKMWQEARAISHWALADAFALAPVEAPLVLLLDLGSDWNDAPGVCLLNHFAPTFIVDHHYAERKHNCGVMINPALDRPELSKYNTAYLVSLLVQNWVKKDDWVRIAAAGDRSPVVEWTKEDRKKALALEMAFNTSRDYRIMALGKKILETDLWKAFWDLFELIIERTLEQAEFEERGVDGKRVLVVWLESTPRYPHKGKIASYLMDEKGYDVVIVADKPFVPKYTVTLRGNANFLEIVKSLGVKEYWGHPNAVTIRTTDPKTSVEDILRKL
ncbi:MAG: hypothetical protein GXN93_03590 [Candidatus Diapherotrites archaeon]|nr:hypothetical protein [Candidatus Diapherotrites archaeon]